MRGQAKGLRARLGDPTNLPDIENALALLAVDPEADVATRNDKVLGVRNGMLGTVSDVDADRLNVKLDTSKHHGAVQARNGVLHSI